MERVNVIFDLDGTLTDPGVGIIRCFQHALAALGRPVADAPALARFIGPPLREAFAELLASDDGVLLTRAVAHFRERFEAVGMFENEVYPGIPDALHEARQHGHRLWVATSKPQPYAQRILQHFGLASAFERIHGSEFSGRHSDKGELLRSVLTQEEFRPSETCMVGDRAYDVIGARKNGVLAIAVLWGYGTAAELTAAGPDRTVRAVSDLCEILS
jgi:phosphoglycolate phosphatase